MKTNDNAHFHIVLVQGVVFKGDKYLMGRRSYQELQDPGEWGVPGGKVEKNQEKEENIIINTLKREIREEVGVEIEDGVFLISNGSFTRKDDAHVVGLTFLCKYHSGNPHPDEDTEEVRWMAFDEVEKECIPRVVELVRKAEEYRLEHNVN